MVIHRHAQSSEKFELPSAHMHTFPAEPEQNDTLPNVPTRTVNKCPFRDLFSPMFFAFLYFLLVICHLKCPQ